MKFRKKPVVIEAVQFHGTNGNEIAYWAHKDLPPQAQVIVNAQAVQNGLIIRTLEGNMYAHPGDWIIKGVKGEFYPCKPDIFEDTYEPVRG